MGLFSILLIDNNTNMPLLNSSDKITLHSVAQKTCVEICLILYMSHIIYNSLLFIHFKLNEKRNSLLKELVLSGRYYLCL